MATENKSNHSFKKDGIPIIAVTLRMPKKTNLPWLENEAAAALKDCHSFAERLLFPRLVQLYEAHPSPRKRFSVAPLSLFLAFSVENENEAQAKTASVVLHISYTMYQKGRLLYKEEHESHRDRETGAPLPTRRTAKRGLTHCAFLRKKREKQKQQCQP